MTDQPTRHPAAPTPAQQGPGATDNAPAAVDARAGVETGTMRYVLIGGVVLAVVVLGAVWAGVAR